MKTIFIVSERGLEEVEIIKETAKQYKMGENRLYRSVINKSEIEIVGSWSHQPYQYIAVSFDRDKAIELWNSYLKKYIKNEREKLDRLEGKLLKG